MGFSKFNSGIIFRVITILLLSLVTAFSLFEKSWFFTPLVSGFLLMVAVFELIRYLNTYSRSLRNFLMTIKQSGFNTSFPEDNNNGNELFKAFNQITDVFQSLSVEKEAGYLFLNPGVLAMGSVGYLAMSMRISWTKAAATMFTIYMTANNGIIFF